MGSITLKRYKVEFDDLIVLNRYFYLANRYSWVIRHPHFKELSEDRKLFYYLNYNYNNLYLFATMNAFKEKYGLDLSKKYSIDIANNSIIFYDEV